MVAILTAATALGILYFLAQSDVMGLYLISNGLPPLLALTAFITASVGLFRNGVRTNDRISLVWLGYSLAMLLWLLGESMWAVYTLWYSIPIPYPSIADIFWLVGYLPLLISLIVQVWPLREVFATKQMRATIILMFALASALLVGLVPPTYASSLGEGFATLAISLAYPLLDVALLSVALPMVLLFRKGTFWRPFLFITIGLILTFVADVLFTWTNLNGTYYDGNYLELFFHWSYLTLTYGFYLRLRHGTARSMLGAG
jgi:hypothetical protein